MATHPKRRDYGVWTADFPDGVIVITAHSTETGYPPRFGGWTTQALTEDTDEDISVELISWMALTERDAAINHQMAVALLESGWRAGDVPDTEVVIHLFVETPTPHETPLTLAS